MLKTEYNNYHGNPEIDPKKFLLWQVFLSAAFSGHTGYISKLQKLKKRQITSG